MFVDTEMIFKIIKDDGLFPTNKSLTERNFAYLLLKNKLFTSSIQNSNAAYCVTNIVFEMSRGYETIASVYR